MKSLRLLSILFLFLLHPIAWAETGFQGQFELEVRSLQEQSKSHGKLEFINPQTLFIETLGPTPQKTWYEGGTLTFYYPKDKRVMAGQLPPAGSALAFDSLAFATTRLGDTPSEHVLLIETKATEAGKLRQIWEVSDRLGRKKGAIHIEEGPSGIEMVAIVDENQVLRRRYRFENRMLIDTQSIPRKIDGEYYDKEGQPIRAERWLLTDLQKLPAAESRQVGKKPNYPQDIKVQALEW